VIVRSRAVDLLFSGRLACRGRGGGFIRLAGRFCGLWLLRNQWYTGQENSWQKIAKFIDHHYHQSNQTPFWMQKNLTPGRVFCLFLL
jgi:hypothetical protein